MFKKRVLMQLLATAALACAALPAAAAGLSESVAAALETHPQIEAGKAALRAAKKGEWEQRAGFYPTFSVTAAGGRVYANNDTTRGLTGGGGAFSWQGQGNMVLTQPLFTGFATLNRAQAAGALADAARHDLGGTEDDVALRAARAHLNLMRTQELLKLADGYYAAIQERHDNIALMVSEGAADAAEELQAQEVLSAARATRLGYEEAWRQAEADYIEVVGAPPAPAPEFGAATWEAHIPASVEDAITHAVQHSPRILSADSVMESRREQAEAAKGELFPRVDAELSYGERDQREALGGESRDAAAMLRLSWDISYGGAEFARIGRGEDERMEARARRRQAMREVEHAVRQKFVSMQIVDQQFDLLASREEDVKGILANYVSQFEAGRQGNLALMNAHARVFEASAARTDAYYRRLLSRFELLAAMGRLRPALAVAADAPGETARGGRVRRMIGVLDPRGE